MYTLPYPDPTLWDYTGYVVVKSSKKESDLGFAFHLVQVRLHFSFQYVFFFSSYFSSSFSSSPPFLLFLLRCWEGLAILSFLQFLVTVAEVAQLFPLFHWTVCWSFLCFFLFGLVLVSGFLIFSF